MKKLLGAEREDAELQEKTEALRLFLEKMDFRKLRAESEKHLVNGRKVIFTIYLEDGVPVYILEAT